MFNHVASFSSGDQSCIEMVATVNSGNESSSFSSPYTLSNITRGVWVIYLDLTSLLKLGLNHAVSISRAPVKGTST